MQLLTEMEGPANPDGARPALSVTDLAIVEPEKLKEMHSLLSR